MENINTSAPVMLIALLASFAAVADDNAMTKEKCLAGDRFQKAAASSDIAFIQSCLKAGTPVDSVEGNGWTALHAAAFSGKEAVVKLLLDAGANTALKDKNGKIPLDLASSKKHLVIAKALREYKDTTAVSDSKAGELAEALRWELNNYGPASSDDLIDYQVVEVLGVEKNDSDSGTVYVVTVKFNVGPAQDEADMVVYSGTVTESAEGDLSVTDYKSAEG